ncbi:MAG: 5-carboxymethyl-2-hydroxymuconate Delta-isomerase [Actinobacteria bacterium]|nr:5-carboxymethyl-2-hydroxymuconate Delta-isomerase [Actinomycetota bacterium]
MPHITIEYSANLDDLHNVQSLVDAVHAAALEHGLSALEALRTRAARRENYRIADGDTSHLFVAIIARIGPGRSDDAKRRFIEALIDAAEAELDHIGSANACAFSVEVQEIDAEFRINRNHVRTKVLEA